MIVSGAYRYGVQLTALAAFGADVFLGGDASFFWGPITTNPVFFLGSATAGVVAKLNPATATISDDAIKAIVLVLKLLMFSLSSLVMLWGIFQYEDDSALRVYTINFFALKKDYRFGS